MSASLILDPDRFFPPEPAVRAVARALFAQVERLPIVSPHGHVAPEWFARNEAFEDAVAVFLWPDHYVLRMLYSQGIDLGRLGLAGGDGPVETDRRSIWRQFAANYHLFRGTPSRLWLDHAFATVFGLDQRLSAETADCYFEVINAALATDAFRPRALFESFGIEVIATTEGAVDALEHHRAIRASAWSGRILTTFRPDDVIDAEREDFAENLQKLQAQTGADLGAFDGYLAALRQRRAFFREAGGATATDHGHPTARTANLPSADSAALYARVRSGAATPADAETFRAQMLTEMALMACEDGMTMQLHPGVWRNHNPWLFEHYGRDKGADIPTRVSYVDGLKPLLDRVGNRRDLTLILFTLDESTYARELAPLAGHYPCLRLGPAWWFNDSPEGMLRFRRQVTETAGFYNTVGFNDDTRAFFSIPARHDLARRMDCAHLAELVASQRLDLDEAHALARDLAYNLPKQAYRL
ncbi:glucuronate isomerase [Phenylobacterium sp. LjRoot225]|uniref:glucuronate isomerase n=1 Tax=Phenylobacterium sp. LjRoot225 TaxID=3342285 RepID=UPI003ECC7D02